MTSPQIPADVQKRRNAATTAFIRRMWAMWHSVRGLSCERMDCEHPWYPA